jgi:hypothetical protein
MSDPLNPHHAWLTANAGGRTVTDLNALLEPGMLVRHPEEPDWGLGQVQSNINGKVTVNFEHMGKVVLDGTRASLELVFNIDD